MSNTFSPVQNAATEPNPASNRSDFVEPSLSSQPTASPFALFAETAERVAATTKRLEKSAILAEYFSQLSDDDLILAARYLTGRAFPLRDQRTTNIGGSALRAALLAITELDIDWINQKLVERGDMGDAAFDAFLESPLTREKPPKLSLQDVAGALSVLASTSGSKQKLALVIDLLRFAPAGEAKYLVKILSGDLRIGLQEGAVEDAIARWSGAEIGKIQWVNMLTGDTGETALLARHGRLDEAKMRLFHPIKFMLATPAADLTDVARQMPEEFVVEDKFDGIRCQAHIGVHVPGDDVLHGTVVDGRRVALFSRTLDEITKSFPDLLTPLAALLPPNGDPLASGLIFDGEIVPVSGETIMNFQVLQQRLGRKAPTAAIAAEFPVAYVAYDALFANGEILLERPFAERRQTIDSFELDKFATIRAAVSKHFTDVAPLDDEFDAARARGNEGLMVKDPASTYKPGRRGREWLKIKRALATLDVVVTAVEVGHGRRNKVLSDYTFAVRTSEDDPTLLNVGKAYSGLTDVEIAEMSEWFRAHTVQEFGHGRVRTVEPKVVIEVTFDNVQASTRHKSGYALRFPRILRIRTDKPPAEIDTLDTVRKLAELDPRQAKAE